PLFELDNFVCTPHIAGGTKKARAKIYAGLADNVTKVLLGEIPNKENMANTELYEKLVLKKSHAPEGSITQ
ncbi:hypothetical protein MUP79_04115, partial [Candidatus Bathyarchaeota archaeon]|nr:hypothetical protein [Candidatus Bathyarchaeota archaeon]